MAVTIDWITRVINVPKADLTVIQSSPTEILELDINWFRLQLKDLEDDAHGMPYVDTHSHFTEVVLGGLTYARVVQVLAPYTVTFEDGQYAVNLVGANSNVADRTNVNQVSVRSNNSAGLVGITDLEKEIFKAQRLIEGLRPHHKSTGDVFYWDPVGGDDANEGTKPDKAKLTFASAQSAARDHNHDVIICLPSGDSTDDNTTTPIQITKNWLFLRGPGFDFKFKPSSLLNGAGIDIQADGVQLEGIRLDMADAGAGATGIKTDGKEFHMKNMIVENATAQGLSSINADGDVLEDFVIGSSGTDGIEFGNNCTDVTISNGRVDSSGASGINISGTGCTDIVLRNNTLVHDSGEYGLEIGSGATDTRIYADTIFRSNTSGEIQDNGTGTSDDRGRVWEVPTAEHVTAGTFGEQVGKKMLTVGKFLGLK